MFWADRAGGNVTVCNQCVPWQSTCTSNHVLSHAACCPAVIGKTGVSVRLTYTTGVQLGLQLFIMLEDALKLSLISAAALYGLIQSIDR
jgi:hypothetical protein